MKRNLHWIPERRAQHIQPLRATSVHGRPTWEYIRVIIIDKGCFIKLTGLAGTWLQGLGCEHLNQALQEPGALTEATHAWRSCSYWLHFTETHQGDECLVTLLRQQSTNLNVTCSCYLQHHNMHTHT